MCGVVRCNWMMSFEMRYVCNSNGRKQVNLMRLTQGMLRSGGVTSCLTIPTRLTQGMLRSGGVTSCLTIPTRLTQGMLRSGGVTSCLTIQTVLSVFE